MIQVKNLTKRFGNELAVDHVNFELPEHGIVGLIGSNGSGKTTLLRLLASIYTIYEGTIEVPHGDLKKWVSMNPKATSMYHLKIDDIRWMVSDLYHDFNASLFDKMMHDQKISSVPFHSLSKGKQQYVLLALTIARDVPIYLFDEPFSGLDIVMRKTLLDQIIGYCDTTKKLVMIASHNLDHVDRLIDEVLFLHQGRLIKQMTKEALEFNGQSIKTAYQELIIGGDSHACK